MEVGIAAQLTKGGCWRTRWSWPGEGRACLSPRRWTQLCLGSSLFGDPEFPGTPLRPGTREASSFKRNTRFWSWKSFHFTDRITEARDRVLPWGPGPRAQQRQCWSRTQVSPPLTRTLSKAPSALPAGPSLLLLLSLGSPSGSPPSPGSQELGDLGPHLPGLLTAAKSREKAGIWRDLSSLWLGPNLRLRAGGAE